VSGPQKQFMSAGTEMASQLVRSRRRCDLTQHYRDPDCRIRHQAGRDLVTLLAQQLQRAHPDELLYTQQHNWKPEWHRYLLVQHLNYQ
jgi:hypothetical protein